MLKKRFFTEGSKFLQKVLTFAQLKIQTSMKKYIEQLLADLAAATHNLPPTPNYKVLYPDHPAHDFGLEYIVAWECIWLRRAAINCS